MNVALHPQDQYRALNAFAPYQQRPIRFLEVWAPDGWKIKLYGMSVGPEVPASGIVPGAFVARAKEVADPILRAQPNGSHHGTGFMLLHQGRLGNWILLDWWTDEILLQHRYFGSQAGRPLDFSPWTAGHIACVWEMAILAFERDAWITSQSSGQTDPIGAYLATTLDGNV
jgi:hypothetical protein